MKIFAILGAALAAIAVGTGAFGAHGLEGRLDERMLDVWETAARYQMYHSLGLLAVAWIAGQVDHVAALVAGWAFVAGIVLFSGSLYVLALSGVRWLGAITPLGGVSFIIGWIALAVAASQLGR